MTDWGRLVLFSLCWFVKLISGRGKSTFIREWLYWKHSILLPMWTT